MYAKHWKGAALMTAVTLAGSFGAVGFKAAALPLSVWLALPAVFALSLVGRSLMERGLRQTGMAASTALIAAGFGMQMLMFAGVISVAGQRPLDVWFFLSWLAISLAFGLTVAVSQRRGLL